MKTLRFPFSLFASLAIFTAIVSPQFARAEAPAATKEADEPVSPPQEETLRHASVPEVAFGGGHYVVEAGEYCDDLTLFGGSLEIRGEVRGDLVLLGAQATISGHVDGDVVAIASRVEIPEGAVLEQELVNVLGRVNRADKASIREQVVDVSFFDFSSFATGRSIFWFFFWLLLWIKFLAVTFYFLVIVLISALLSERVAFAANVLPGVWGRSFLFGVLVFVLSIFSILVLAITIVGIPLALLVAAGLKIVTWIGLAAIFCLIGRELGRNVMGRDLTFFTRVVVGFLLFAVVYFVPIMGELVKGILGVTGLGLMTITRLGTRTPGAALPGAGGMAQPAASAGPLGPSGPAEPV